MNGSCGVWRRNWPDAGIAPGRSTMPIDLMPHLFSAAVRASGLGLVAFLGLLLFHIRSSAARHAMWTVVLVGMLLQMPLGTLAPAVRLQALPTPFRTRVMESAGIPVPATQTPAPASQTHTEPKGRWVSSSAMLTGVYLAVSMLLFIRMAFGSSG